MPPSAADVVVQSLSADARLLLDGEKPKSYAAVLTSIETLLARYGDGDDAERSAIKGPLRQLGAHLNPFARGAVPGADVSVDEFFRRITAAAAKATTAMTEGQHDAAVRLGLARPLVLPKDAKKGKLKQDAFMPFLKPKFKKKIARLLADERYAQLDPDEVCAVMMLFVGGFVDGQLKTEGLADQIQSFQDAQIKDFLRVMVKLLSDYDSEENPHAHLLDIVRRSATAPLGDQELFIARLVERGNFVKIRTKETLTDPHADIKFVNVCVAYTPTSKTPKGKAAATSYAAMLRDPGWLPAVAAAQAQNPEITDLLKEAALTLLGDKSLAKKLVTMIVELQMYVAEFLKTKKALHAIYKFGRPANLVDLTKDLAKFATKPEMAHQAQAGEYNEAYLLRTPARLGLPRGKKGGVLNLGYNVKLRAAIKNEGETEVSVCGLIMGYCGVLGIKTLM